MANTTSISFLSFFFFLFCSISLALTANVTYDHRSLIINGRRKLLISASIHYPRSVPAMWPGLVAAAKEGGVDAIETYVFWNGHELSPGRYYFEERFDLVKFVSIVRDAGMYLILRIGPFVAGEWNFGGVPVWLHYERNTVFRTNNENFKSHMKSFMAVIINMMKKEKFFASQGGPIILAQVENEYGDIEKVYGDGGKPYAMWAASMALSHNIGVPWIMCQQNDAPGPVINTCNSFYCDYFKPNSVNKPKIWTENWPGWFRTFGARNPHRPPEDVAFAVARFFQKGGSVQNYYMYHGGTNFGRTSGGPFITTSYDYDAPIDEYGLARFPKWAHLKGLHKSIKLCENQLLFGEPTIEHLGPLQEADVYRDSSGACAAFISNMDEENDKVVVFQDRSYHLPAWSVSILPDCQNVVFNTAKISSQTFVVDMVPEKLRGSMNPSNEASGDVEWAMFREKARIWGRPDFVKQGFVDHINTTKDSTDYLWYATSLYVDNNEKFLRDGSQPVLMVESKGHAVQAFINQGLQGIASGDGARSAFSFETSITLKAGRNEIALLSMTVGLQNAGPFFEWVGAGLTSVKISGFRNGTVDLTSSTWMYKIGLEGEKIGLYSADGINNVKWISKSKPPQTKPLTWYKAVIDPPSGTEPVGLDMLEMGKGQVWLNGNPVGRYWPRTSSEHGCPQACNYRGKFFPDKCDRGCGQPTQRWYHVPRSWFQPSGNTLVILEERGADPTKITFSKRRVTGVCGLISENYPSFDLETWDKTVKHDEGAKPLLHLKCPESTNISSVRFASFGNPSGTCGSYQQGSCHHPHSVSVVEKVCLNKNECVVSLSESEFTQDSCPGVMKTLAIEAACS